MSRTIEMVGLLLLAAVTSSPAAAWLLPAARAQQPGRAAGEILQTSVALSGDEASLELELSGGHSLRIRFADGRIYVDGDEVGRYALGGRLETAWRDMLRGIGADEVGTAWASFGDAEFEAGEAEAAGAVRAALAPLLGGSAPSAAAAAASASQEPVQLESPSGAPASERVVGGLVVEVTGSSGLARSLRRIGLAPELSRALNGALEPPFHIVIEADDYQLPEGARIDGSLWLVETDGVVAGSVAGNVFVADGSLVIAPSAVIEGDLITADASVHNQGGTILGAVRELDEFAPVLVAPSRNGPGGARAPRGAGSVLRDVRRGVGSLAKTLGVYLVFAFVGALIVYFFRAQLETVSDTVSYSFGRSFLAGLAAEILFFPILLVLAVLVLTWIAIPFYVLGAGVACLLGYLAVAHAAGENLTRHRYPSWAARMRRSNSYYYVFNGLAVLLGAYAIAAVFEMAGAWLSWLHALMVAAAAILTWIAGTAGFGATLLSRAGTQRKYARPRKIPELPIEAFTEELRPIRRGSEVPRPKPQSEGEADES